MRSEIVHEKIKVSKNSGLGSSALVSDFVKGLHRKYGSFHLALYLGQDLLACTNQYFSLDPVDKQVFYVIKEI